MYSYVEFSASASLLSSTPPYRQIRTPRGIGSSKGTQNSSIWNSFREFNS